MKDFYNSFLSIRQLNVPTIAAINGPCVGAGLCLATACDLRVTSKNVKLAYNFSKVRDRGRKREEGERRKEERFSGLRSPTRLIDQKFTQPIIVVSLASTPVWAPATFSPA